MKSLRATGGPPGSLNPRALLLDDDLQVLGRQDQCTVAGAVAARRQVEQLGVEDRLPDRVGLERREGAVHRAVPGAEDIHEVLGRSIAEGKMAADGVQIHRGTEELVEPLARAPEGWRLEPGRRWNVLSEHPEHLADE